MFAAFQKASKSSQSLLQIAGWNWVPVTVSEHLLSKKNQDESKTGQTENKMILSDRDETSGKNEKWFEIPLSSDDEDHISPRGVLQFRKISCSETTGKENDYESDEQALCIDVTSVCQQRENTQHSTWQGEKSKDDNSNVTIPQLSSRDPEASKGNDAQLSTSRLKNLDSGDAEIHLRRPRNSEPKAIGANETLQKSPRFIDQAVTSPKNVEKDQQSTGNNRTFYVSMESNVDSRIDKMDKKVVEHKIDEESTSEKIMPDGSLPPIKPVHDAKCGTDYKMNELLNAETQTIGYREDFSSTKMALQRQLSDALSALDLTRNQANALRDRLRTYTSSMRQQAGDLRESSRSLNHALDKAMEYKTKWKDETKRREVVEKRVNEMEKEAKEAQKVLTSKTDEIKFCHDGLNELGKLVKCDEISTVSLRDKTNRVSTKVRGLLESMERVQADSCLANMKNVVEMKECLQKYEKEKKKWEILQKNNDAIFKKELQKVETEKCLAQEELKHAKESAVELKSRHELKLRVIEDKNTQLQKSYNKVTNLEETVSMMQARLKNTISALESSSEENKSLRRNFQANHAKFGEEKKQLEAAINTLQQKLRDRTVTKVELSVQCDLSRESDRRLSGSQSPLRSSAIVDLYLESENEGLQWNIKQLEESYAELKNRYFHSRGEYDRLAGDFRHLNRTCHRQQVSVQHLRMENASLNRSVKELKRTIEAHKAKIDESKSSEGSDKESPSDPMDISAIKKSHSRNTSVSDADSRLETIAENSIEENRQTENFNSSNTELYPVKVLTPNTAIVRPYQHTPETVSLQVSKSCTNEDNSTESSNEVKQQNVRRSRSRSSRTSTRRSRKSHQSNHLPVWRQENPENQFSISNISNDIENGDSSSEDVFISSSNLLSANSSSAYGVDASEKSDALYCPNSDSRGKRLVGIPMREVEFQQMLGESMHDNSSSIGYSYSNDMSYGDDLSSTHISIDDGNSKYLHSTLLFPNSRLSSLNSEPNSKDDNSVSEEGEKEHYLINYKGATFDAATFNFTQMRQIAWEVGCSESEVEMNKFIDFLAKMANKLNDDPQWRGKHSLGKSSDWIGLKGLF